MKQQNIINKNNNISLSNVEKECLLVENSNSNASCCQTHTIALNSILNELKILNKNFNKNEIDENESNLKFSAMVVDRFCLWFIIILTLFSSGFILFTSKNSFKFT